jgi:hypothetical protein
MRGCRDSTIGASRAECPAIQHFTEFDAARKWQKDLGQKNGMVESRLCHMDPRIMGFIFLPQIFLPLLSLAAVAATFSSSSF